MANTRASDSIPSDASDAVRETQDRLNQGAASARKRASGARNYTKPEPPQVYYVKGVPRYYYEELPLVITTQMQSPLKQEGKYAIGPNKERLVTSKWGDARAATQTDSQGKVESGRRHMGLDFRADVGEIVMATADGVVRAIKGNEPGGVRMQRSKGGPAFSTSFEADSEGVVRDASGEVVGRPRHKDPVSGKYIDSTIGFGGIYVEIHHRGEYAGYKSQYMHLSKTLVKPGQEVKAGDPIGQVGNTGGNDGIVGPAALSNAESHLHWQIQYKGVVVKPMAFVPFADRNGRAVTEASSVALSTAVLSSLDQAMPQFMKNALGQGVRQVLANARNTAMANLTRQQHAERQADHYEAVAKTLDARSQGLYEIARFQSQFLVVTEPMQFDFDNGYWTDDGEVV